MTSARRQIPSFQSEKTGTPARVGLSWIYPGERGWVLLWGLLIVASTIVTFDPKLFVSGDNVSYIRLAESARAGDLWASTKLYRTRFFGHNHALRGLG